MLPTVRNNQILGVAVGFVFKSQVSEHRTLKTATLSIWWFQQRGGRRWGGEQWKGFTSFVSAQTSDFLPLQSLPPGTGWEELEANPCTPMRLGWDPDARASDLVLEGRVSGIRPGTDFHIHPHDPPTLNPNGF